LEEKGILHFDDHAVEVKVLALSPKGALIDMGNKVRLLANDKFKLSIKPGNSIILLNFEGVVVQCRDNLAGVKFVPVEPSMTAEKLCCRESDDCERKRHKN